MSRILLSCIRKIARCKTLFCNNIWYVLTMYLYISPHFGLSCIRKIGRCKTLFYFQIMSYILLSCECKTSQKVGVCLDYLSIYLPTFWLVLHLQDRKMQDFIKTEDYNMCYFEKMSCILRSCECKIERCKTLLK